jgi:hypothetical protein
MNLLRTWCLALAVAALTLVAGVAQALEAPAPSGVLSLTPLGTYATGVIGESAAEIVAYEPASKRLFVTNADANAIDVIDIADPANPTKTAAIDLSGLGGGINSVAVQDGVVACALEAENKQAPGVVALYASDDLSRPAKVLTVGALPDMVAIGPGGMAIVCCEGEPNDAYTTDPEGTVWSIDLRKGPAAATATEITFADYSKDDLHSRVVRVFGPGATGPQDLEPEYAAFSPDGRVAYVCLQENNAIAVIDVMSAKVMDVVGLGFKDHDKEKNALDVSNKDGAINMTTWPHLQGMFQPDAIATFERDGQAYLITANEGDARDYDGFSEESRVAKVELDPEAFPDAAAIQAEDKLGRLKITTTLGDEDGDGDFDELYSYGGRSFSIWRVRGAEMKMVYDSASDLELITAVTYPDNFNSTDDENDSFDDRSDDKGPEPEAITVGEIGGRTYAFIGLERIGGVMTFDVTDPLEPVYVDYVNTRDFSGDVEAGTAGDLAPEGLAFIPAVDSPTGEDLLAVAFEVSGTTTIFAIR